MSIAQTTPEGMECIFKRPSSMQNRPFHFCPGCGHSIAHRLIGETLDELGVVEKTIAVGSVGCSHPLQAYFPVDYTNALHGRAPSMATGIKRAHPECIVFTYQGDGDLASIGMGEIVHAAARGEQITVIFANNAVYGMTGAQMAPTTLTGQVTTTTPYGRDPIVTGYPIRVAEMLALLDGVCFSERCSVDGPANIRKAKVAVKKAFQNQAENRGFSIVELLTACPEGWHMPPAEAVAWQRENMLKTFPLGKFKDTSAEGR